MEQILQDVRFGVRMLRKSPGFTSAAVLTLALGIGATTAIFSVVYGVLLRPLPYQAPDRIVRLWEKNQRGHDLNFTDPNFEDLSSQNRSFQGLAEYGTWPEPVTGGSQPTRSMTASVSFDFFPLMRVQPIRGRSFAREDHHFGAAPVALVSYNYWQQYLGSPSDLSSSKLTIENRAVSVIGVLPPKFNFPDSSEIWVPRELYERLPSRTAHNWRVIGRLRDGVTFAQARAEVSTVARQIKTQFGQDVDITDVLLARLQDAMTSDVRPALVVLLGAVGFLLLIACANVANLLLAQSSARDRELAIRTAIGASRGRLVRQFLTESLLLSLAGGALGVLLARYGVLAFLRLAPPDMPLLEEVSVSLPALLCALGISLVVALVLGIFSAVRATSNNLRQVLAEHALSQTDGRRGQRLGEVIIAGQMAITLVLLTGAGLLGRSFLSVLSVDPGFRTEHIVVANLALPSAETDAIKVHHVAFLNQLLGRLRTIPGVEEAGGTGELPLAESFSGGTYMVMNPGERAPEKMEELERWFHNASRTGHANYASATEGYFWTMGIPLVRGRWFEDRDTMDAPHVALINQALARQQWPKQDPLGRTLEFGNMDGDLRPLTVVGVIGDTRDNNLEMPPSPTVYTNYRQRPQGARQLSVVLRSKSDPAQIISSAREIVRSLDPNLPPTFSTFTQIFASSLRPRQLNLTLIAAFAGTALGLAMIGLYGVVAYTVARRTGEFGIRIALGASAASIFGLVLKRGLLTTLAGTAIGLVGALALARTLRSFLFGLSATDPWTFIAVPLLLIFVAVLAIYVPARRAAKLDPMVGLRYE
jgi:putative ABC transport system permease protein